MNKTTFKRSIPLIVYLLYTIVNVDLILFQLEILLSTKCITV